MNWLQRLAHFERKERRARVRKNVRAFRSRARKVGMHRLDVMLTTSDYSAFCASALPGETVSATFARLMKAVTGNPERSSCSP